MKTVFKAIFAAVCACAVMMSAVSCSFMTEVSARDLTEGYVSKAGDPGEPEAEPAAVDFALSLLRETAKGEKGANVIMSPYSVLTVLALAANGAAGDTLSEMEGALGMTLSRLNEYMSAYRAAIGKEKNVKLAEANSIWFRDGALSVRPGFLQTNADIYGADAFAAPFNAETVRDINAWISKHTDGMIDEMIKEISDGTVMYLINTVLFDAEWEHKYEKSDISEGIFISSDENRETVDFMYCDSDLGFRLDGAVGLVRKYSGGSFEFAAVLPDFGSTPEEYLEKLDGAALTEALSGKLLSATTSIPKFAFESELEISDVLKSMGITSLFDGGKADLTGIDKDGGLYVSEVLHSAKIEVNEAGTRAGAATVSGIDCENVTETALIVKLTRPFVFFICDTATHTPVFCGIVNSVAG